MNPSSPEETETANTTVLACDDSSYLLSENDVNQMPQPQQSLTLPQPPSSSPSSCSDNDDDPILPDAVLDMMDWDGDYGPTLTGRPPKCLYLSCDADNLNQYQCLIRQNMEFFEATQHDLSIKVRGRNKPIVLGQVGLRCMHCCKVMSPGQHASPSSSTHAPKGSVYYPQILLGIYQSAQTLANGHWIDPEDHQKCTAIQPFVRQQMQQLKECTTVERQYSQGKEYWATQAAVLGVIEHPQWGLRFKPLDTPHV
ncbi:hypothetical protein IV203_021446 [Nitzschia inconspicua]|uniref:Uncharacterized protein n=1 Tax=Nitzschia inconspicua TaxID=303405 RepID=A0A9K3KHU5_9STRA|nr:hypothetical protein IV203_021446 [Nitzschia inconspicua]